MVLHGHEAIKEMSLSEDCLGRPTGPFYEMRTWNKRLGQFFYTLRLTIGGKIVL